MIGDADLHRQVHDLHDLGGVGFRQRSAEHGEVLRERKHLATVDQPVTGDDAVAGDDLLGHAEVAAAVRDQLVELFEGAGIEQQIDALARRELAGGVLPFEAFLAAARARRAVRDPSRVSLGHCKQCQIGSLGFHRLRFFPVLQEFLEADARERVVEELIDDGRRTRADVARPCAPLRRCESGAGSWRRALRW